MVFTTMKDRQSLESMCQLDFEKFVVDLFRGETRKVYQDVHCV